MVYLRSKMINGCGPYWYLVYGERIGPRVHQRHLKYLGRFGYPSRGEPGADRFPPGLSGAYRVNSLRRDANLVKKEFKSKKRRFFGLLPVIGYVMESDDYRSASAEEMNRRLVVTINLKIAILEPGVASEMSRHELREIGYQIHHATDPESIEERQRAHEYAESLDEPLLKRWRSDPKWRKRVLSKSFGA